MISLICTTCFSFGTGFFGLSALIREDVSIIVVIMAAALLIGTAGVILAPGSRYLKAEIGFFALGAGLMSFMGAMGDWIVLLPAAVFLLIAVSGIAVGTDQDPSFPGGEERDE